MTDNDIKKAFEECYVNNNATYCGGCPYNISMCDDRLLARDIFDYINRLEAENERLKIAEKGTTEMLKFFVSDDETYRFLLKDAIEREKVKQEAYKEFADRLKYRYSVFHTYSGGFVKMEIDNLLKEMVGEDK